MNADDEQLLRGRVYGHDHDDPNPGPLPHQTYAALVGGPLDGLLLDITGWRPEEIGDGVALMTVLGRRPGGRALYDPLPDAPRPAAGPGAVCRFHYSATHPDRRASGVAPVDRPHVLGRPLPRTASRDLPRGEPGRWTTRKRGAGATRYDMRL